MTTREIESSPSRRGGAYLWRLDTPFGLAAMFAVALLVRVLIAPHAGFYGDLRLFQIWANRLDDVGPRHFYVEGQFADYPPGYLYVLWLLAKISSGTPGYLLLKLPAILADLGLAWIAGTFAARLAPASLRERVPVRAMVAAAVLFNPAVIALSAVWGQVDAVPAMFVLWSLLLLFTGPQSLRREIAALLLFAIAIAMKPQTGFVFPVILYALYRRYLYRRPRAELVDGALSIGVMGASSLGLWAVSGLPFGLGPVSLVRFYQHSASVYPFTSANAFNLWGAIGFWRHDSAGDHVLTIAGISALRFGTLLFALGAAAVLWRAHRALGRGADEARTLTIAAAVVGLLAFAVLTRMHERYLFLSLAALAPLVFDRRLRLAYVGLSALFVLNLWYPYAYFNSQWHVQDFHVQPWFGWILGGFTDNTWQKRVWSLGVTAIAIAVAWRGIPLTGKREQSSSSSGLAGGFRRLRAAEFHAAAPETTRSRWWPLSLVGLSCIFGLVVLRGETNAAPNLNDSAFHLQMVRWAHGQIGEGRVPLDGWFPDLSLGSSFFHHYQSLSETLTAYAASASGASDQTTYLWIQYLLLALWPISVYVGARLLGWGRWTAAASAAVSPLIVSAPGYGYEHSSYVWQGYGVYSQLWAMWLLPIAWGLTWRAVTRGRSYAVAALALALTIACHFITGYLAMLTVGIWVIVLGAGFLRNAWRAALVAGGSLLVASWVLVPLIGDTKFTTQSEYYKRSIFNDSYGARKILGWLFTGELFDKGRFPVVTVLFFVGVLICVLRVRHDVRARALLGVFTLSLLLFFGRPTLGPVLDLLPGFSDIQIHRFIVGVDLAGILIAGVGLGWLLRAASRVAELLPTGRYALAAGSLAAIVLAVGVLAPAWADRGAYDLRGADSIRGQQATDANDGLDLDRLIAIVKARGDGRVYAGLRGNWGIHYTVGSVPVHVWLADRDVDAIGFTFRTIASLSTDVEAAFDETNPAQYQMFGIRYLILPSDRKPPVPAKLLTRSGRHRLWEVQTSGYFQVVDRSTAVTANRTNVEQVTQGFRQSDLASRGIYPGVAFAGAAAPQPTFTGADPPAGPAGSVLTQSATLQDGVFTAAVTANRPAVVLLKASFDPRWNVTVDGLPATPVMMAPSLVGVDVPTGSHTVRFGYKRVSRYPLLFAIGVLTLLGLTLYPRRAGLRMPGFLRGTNEAREPDAPAGPVGVSTGGVESSTRPLGWRAGLRSVALGGLGHPPFGRTNGPLAESDREGEVRLDAPLATPVLDEPMDGVPIGRPLSLRSYLASSRVLPLTIALTLFGVFLPSVTVPYAFADDYSILWMTTGGGPSPQFGKTIFDAATSEGRPIVGVLDQLFFSAAGTIDNLRFVRLFAVACIIVLALLLHWALVRSRIKPTVASLIAILVCSLPAFQVYSSWTTLFTVPLGAILGGSASRLVVTTVGATRRFAANRLGWATAMLLCGLLIYQPTAMFFWVFLAVALIGAAYESRRLLPIAKIHFVVAGVALALWYLILKLSIHLVGNNAPGGHRSTLTHDVAGKVRWFLGQPLYRSLNLFDLTPSPWFAAVVVTVAAGGTLLLLRRWGVRPLPYFGLALALIPLSYLPNLVVAENWAAYRTQVSISSLIALYFSLGAIGIWLTFADWIKPRVSGQALVVAERFAVGVALVFVAASAFVGSRNVTTLIAEPQATELRLLRGQVAALNAGVPRIAFVETDWHGGLTNLVVYDEFGLASSVRPWAHEPSVDLILREEGKLTTQGPRPVYDIYPSYSTTLPSDEPVIDLRGLQQLR